MRESKMIIKGNMNYTSNGRSRKTLAWAKSKSRPIKNTFKFDYTPPRGRQAEIKSLQTNDCATSKPEKKEYTGTLVKGISTMHKSNAVPILDEQEAKDHASMRR